jgi:hypothetical protein
MGAILNNFHNKFFFWFILRIMFHYFSDVCVLPNVMLAFNRTSSWHKYVKICWVFWCLKSIWYYKNTDIPRLTQQLSSVKSSRNHVLCKMEFTHLVNCNWNSNLNTTEPDWQQHDCPVACVMAQQYSPATFASLCFQFHKETFGDHFKKCHFKFFFKCISLNSCNLKLHNLGSVC